MISRTCRTCGKSFEVPPEQAARKYCGDPCERPERVTPRPKLSRVPPRTRRVDMRVPEPVLGWVESQGEKTAVFLAAIRMATEHPALWDLYRPGRKRDD